MRKPSVKEAIAQKLGDADKLVQEALQLKMGASGSMDSCNAPAGKIIGSLGAFICAGVTSKAGSMVDKSTSNDVMNSDDEKFSNELSVHNVMPTEDSNFHIAGDTDDETNDYFDTAFSSDGDEEITTPAKPAKKKQSESGRAKKTIAKKVAAKSGEKTACSTPKTPGDIGKAPIGTRAFLYWQRENQGRIRREFPGPGWQKRVSEAWKNEPDKSKWIAMAQENNAQEEEDVLMGPAFGRSGAKSDDE